MAPSQLSKVVIFFLFTFSLFILEAEVLKAFIHWRTKALAHVFSPRAHCTKDKKPQIQ